MTVNTLWGRSPSQARVGLFHDLAKRTDFASKVTFGSFLSLTHFKTQCLKEVHRTLKVSKTLALQCHPQLDGEEIFAFTAVQSRLKLELQTVTACHQLGGVLC